jgi:hypothetical protein
MAAVLTELLDRNCLITVSPNLGNLKRGVDFQSVDPRWRDVDFGGQIGVWIVGDVVGFTGRGHVGGRDLGHIKVITQVRLDSTAFLGSLPGG